MELAGLACAQTVAKVYTPDKFPRVLVCCGPGNQGTSQSPTLPLSRNCNSMHGDKVEMDWLLLDISVRLAHPLASLHRILRARTRHVWIQPYHLHA